MSLKIFSINMTLNKPQANILITNSHAPTFPGTVYSIKQEFTGNIISTSRKEEGIHALISDKNYTIHKEDPDKYVKDILSICEEETISVIVPLSIKERIMFLENKKLFNEKNIKIFSSSIESIEKSENKILLFEICKENDIPVAEFYVVEDYADLKEKALLLGYPKNKVVVKPVKSSGSRGLRILNKKADYKKMFYHMRADHTEITLSDLKNIIGKKFQPLMLCEYLPGKEYTVDCLRQGNYNFAFSRIRTEVKNGLTSVGEMSEHKEIIQLSKKLAELLDLTTVFGFQFKLNSNNVPVMIDCNPRIQGTMIMSTLADANIIAEGIKFLLAECKIEFNPDWTMKYYRFWSGVSNGRTKKIVNF